MQLSTKHVNKRVHTKRYEIYVLIAVTGAFSKSFLSGTVVYAPLQLVMALIWHTHTNTAPLGNQFV